MILYVVLKPKYAKFVSGYVGPARQFPTEEGDPSCQRFYLRALSSLTSDLLCVFLSIRHPPSSQSVNRRP